MTPLAAFRTVRDSTRDLAANHGLKMAAALAYYAALSLAPLLLTVLFVAGLVLERSVVAEAIAHEMERVLGGGAGELLRSFADEPKLGGGVLATVLGAIAFAFGATGLFVELQDDLNILWGAQARARSGIVSFLRDRLLSFAMVVSIGFLLLVSFLVNSALSLLARPIEDVTGAHVVVATIVHAIVALFGDAAFFAFIFKVLPDARVRWRDVIRGGIATSFLFVAGQFAIAEYLGRAAIGSAWGAAGSLVLLLVWVYYSSIIVLFGAALTHRLPRWRERPPAIGASFADTPGASSIPPAGKQR